MPLRFPLAAAALLVLAVAAMPLRADQIELVTGETLTGTIVDETEGQIVFEHPSLGEISVPMEQVVAVQRSEQEAQEAAEAPAEPAVEPEKEPVPQRKAFLEDWDFSLSLGFSGSEGNSVARSLNAQFKAMQEDDWKRWLFDNKYFYGSSDGTTDQNEFNSTLTRDWLHPDKPWFYFATGIYDYDQFEAWRHRASAFAGAGYEFVKRDDLAVNGRLGAGVTKEFGDEADELRPEALIGLELLRWHITDNQNLTAATTLFPDLGDLPENRVVSSIEWTVDLNQGDGLKIKLGVAHEYESETEDDSDHSDLKYYGALTFDF